MERGAAVRAVSAVIVVTTAGVLPVFLTGGVSVQMRDDLGFGAGGLGAAVTAFFVTTAVCSAPMGRLAGRLGTDRSMRAACVVAGVSLAGVAAGARSLGWLVAFLVVGASANALAQPASNAYIIERIPGHRQGLAFGVKQSAIPVSTLLGGLAVPALALTVGWRWAFAGGAAVAVTGTLLVGGGRARTAEDGSAAEYRRVDPGPLLVLAAGVFLGAAAANALGAFLIDSAVRFGFGEGAAGLLQAAASAAGVGVRLFAGWRADQREGGNLPIVAALLVAGAGGFALMATGAETAYAVGVIAAFAFGWGWPGLANFAVSRRYAHAPAAATGITQTGVAFGAAAGPFAFGLLAGAGAYRTAWALCAVVAVAAAVTVLAGRRVLLAAAQ